MHPAPSVILFTALSGLGFGMLAWLGMGYPSILFGKTAFTFYFFAFALSVGGLLASTFHLGNPKNAIKAFSQWRTSWLSREGVCAVLALLVMGVYAIGLIFLGKHWAVLGYFGAFLSIATVFTTSMIYAQLKTVPRWNHWTTNVMFMFFAIVGGALITRQIDIAVIGLLVTGAFQILSWRIGDGQFQHRGSTIETATALGFIGKVRMLEPPHTGTNYLLREMVYVVGRKHVLKLRIISILCMVIMPVLLLQISSDYTIVFAAICFHVIGVFASRWLFFAQAEHVVGLYYDKR